MIAENVDSSLDPYGKKEEAKCCFCGTTAPGLPATDAINHTYFTDYDLMQHDTDHVCQYCAYCIDSNTVRNGHWFANQEQFLSITTGDLPVFLADLAAGEYDPPFALFVSQNPVRSNHGYLWTPVSETCNPFTAAFGEQTVTVEWEKLDVLRDAVEELRSHSFRLDDIRFNRPRTENLESVGIDRYRELSQFLNDYRGSTLFELAVFISRSSSDQPSDGTTADIHTDDAS